MHRNVPEWCIPGHVMRSQLVNSAFHSSNQVIVPVDVHRMQRVVLPHLFPPVLRAV